MRVMLSDDGYDAQVCVRPPPVIPRLGRMGLVAVSFVFKIELLGFSTKRCSVCSTRNGRGVLGRRQPVRTRYHTSSTVTVTSSKQCAVNLLEVVVVCSAQNVVVPLFCYLTSKLPSCVCSGVLLFNLFLSPFYSSSTCFFISFVLLNNNQPLTSSASRFLPCSNPVILAT
ncbi:hypothetical protein L873DRAFT_1106372 [Choiromyces venosus 120613-1]|uniref:Uncharacterized protein n=1 Tax=Choiromyces venosus 120613-1 TaxID=1336337 RepID=A0A3N4JL51_9PEZI|nr:hypothetical protein L873DRAFT_1106372 [Choiromyces venosus 120613-1]